MVREYNLREFDQHPLAGRQEPVGFDVSGREPRLERPTPDIRQEKERLQTRYRDLRAERGGRDLQESEGRDAILRRIAELRAQLKDMGDPFEQARAKYPSPTPRPPHDEFWQFKPARVERTSDAELARHQISELPDEAWEDLDDGPTLVPHPDDLSDNNLPYLDLGDPLPEPLVTRKAFAPIKKTKRDSYGRDSEGNNLWEPKDKQSFEERYQQEKRYQQAVNDLQARRADRARARPWQDNQNIVDARMLRHATRSESAIQARREAGLRSRQEDDQLLERQEEARATRRENEERLREAEALNREIEGREMLADIRKQRNHERAQSARQRDWDNLNQPDKPAWEDISLKHRRDQTLERQTKRAALKNELDKIIAYLKNCGYDLGFTADNYAMSGTDIPTPPKSFWKKLGNALQGKRNESPRQTLTRSIEDALNDLIDDAGDSVSAEQAARMKNQATEVMREIDALS